MQKIFPILLASMILLSSCSIDWNDEKDRKINELSSRISHLEDNDRTSLVGSGQKIPEYSFRTHLIQFGGIHSKLYDWVFWELTRGSDAPTMDSSIQDLLPGLVSIDFRGRKDFFTISCPATFQIKNCSQNHTNIDWGVDNSCTFYFSDEWKNTDIMFDCINDKFQSDI